VGTVELGRGSGEVVDADSRDDSVAPNEVEVVLRSSPVLTHEPMRATRATAASTLLLELRIEVGVDSRKNRHRGPVDAA
jgi:hypothetical protein